MRAILNTVRPTLNDLQFIAEHRYQPTDFTRKRILTFERVAPSLLSGPIACKRPGNPGITAYRFGVGILRSAGVRRCGSKASTASGVVAVGRVSNK